MFRRPYLYVFLRSVHFIVEIRLFLLITYLTTRTYLARLPIINLIPYAIFAYELLYYEIYLTNYIRKPPETLT